MHYTCEYDPPSCFWYILHLPITPCSYIKLLFLCILRLSLRRRNTLIKNAISSSPHDSQEIARLDEDSERSSVVDYRISPTLASQVLALTWQLDMWLHVAYGVKIAILPIWLNCMCYSAQFIHYSC